MQQKVILITGVSSGIGAATARGLAEAGHRVFGGARSPETVPAIPGVEIVQFDVRSEEEVGAGVAYILNTAGRIDILVNNAGISLVGPVEATTTAEARALFDTNVFGVLNVIRAVLPAMRQQRSGLIVNLSSVLGFLPAPFMGLYASSKHALEGLSESLEHELREFGIRVVLVEPSFTNTKLDTNARRSSGQIADYAAALSLSVEAVQRQVKTAPPPEAVARKIIKVIASPRRLREPADGRAKLLSALRRFVPVKQMDKSLRSAFGLRPLPLKGLGRTS